MAIILQGHDIEITMQRAHWKFAPAYHQCPSPWGTDRLEWHVNSDALNANFERRYTHHQHLPTIRPYKIPVNRENVPRGTINLIPLALVPHRKVPCMLVAEFNPQSSHTTHVPKWHPLFQEQAKETEWLAGPFAFYAHLGSHRKFVISWDK